MVAGRGLLVVACDFAGSGCGISGNEWYIFIKKSRFVSERCRPLRSPCRRGGDGWCFHWKEWGYRIRERCLKDKEWQEMRAG